MCLLLGLSVSCSKDRNSGSDPATEKTTVNFKNELTKALPKVMIGIFRENYIKLVKNYGPLEAGAFTGDIVIDPEEAQGNVFFYFENEDKTYYNSIGFPVDKGTNRTMPINNSVNFVCVGKTSFMYPK